MDFNDVLNLSQHLEQAMKDRGHINLLIAGKTGVGKSTLINAVFQGDFATTGQGRPITAETTEIRKEGIPLTLIDTRGIEVKAYKETLNQLEHFLQARSKESDVNRQLHVAWMCISEDARRVEDAEKDLVTMLSRYMKVIVVITKARSDQGYQDVVQNELPEAVSIIRVRAISEQYDDGHISAPMGLEELIQATQDILPEAVRDAFAAAQKASMQEKIKRARSVVTKAATAAATAGATPIPGSDAPILITIQVGMLAKINGAFGLNMQESFMGTMLGAVIGTTGATVTGKLIVSTLLKFIPGAGTIIGGIISGATAATLTTAIGNAYIGALTVLTKDGNLQLDPTEIARVFKEQLMKDKTLPSATAN